MADEKQSTPVVQDPLAEYDQKAAAPQEQDLPNYQGLVPAEDHEKTDHVLPKGLAVSKNNVHLPTGLVYDDDNTGHVKASAEEQKYESGPSAGQPVRAGDYQLRKSGPVINLISAGQEPGKITVHNPIMPLPGEEFQDTMKRAIEAGKKVTPAQIREEEEEDFLNAPGVMASAVALGATGPVIYGGAKGVSILKQLTVGGDSQILGHPENLMTPETQKAHPYWTGALEMAGGLSSPENAAMLIGSGALGKLAGPGAKVAQKMVSYGFGTAMVSGAIKKVPELWDVMQGTGQYEDMSDSDRESLAKKMVFHITADSAMGAMVLEHGITGENAPLTDIGEKTEALLSKQAQNISRIKFRAVADTVGEMFGKTSDFGKSIMRASNMLGKKAGPEFEVKVKNVSNDLKAVLNNDVNNKIVDPKSAAQAIDSHLKTAIDAPLLQEAGATKDSAEPVAPNFRKRLEERLDKFFQDTAGRYASGDQVEKAKERIIDRTEMQHDFGNGVTVPRDPNLFEAENIRQGLNAEGAASPFEDSANVESNAYKAAARETAAFMREVIDEAYDSKGVRGVKEARSKEADLIDIRDALFDSQRIADKQEATPGILKLFSLGKMAGMVGAIVAHFASSNLLSGALAAGTLWKHIHEGNVGDVVGNLERAKALAGRTPGAKATVPMPGGPELQGPSPAPPTPPVTPPPTAPEGFPAPPQPPAPVTPPQVNHRLYGALSSYFGEFLGSRPYPELLQEFSNQVADMRQDIKSQGGKYSQEQIDKASKLQEKINDAHGQEHESVAKQNATNQAKYEKEKIKYEQKLKAELAKQEQKRQTEDKQRTEQAKASLLKDERIAHSPVLKATDEPLEITGIEGRSSEQNHGHEHGHIMGASAEGLEPSVFVSDQHPDAVEDGAAAQVHIDTSMAEKGPKGVAQKVVAILSGPAFDEVHHDMKMSKNTGARDDISRARQLLRETGLRGGALETVFDALYDRAKDHVSNPEALAVAQANMRVREAGLSPKFHISAGRMAEYVKKLQGAYGNVKAQSAEVLREGDAGGRDEDGESDLAGRAREKQAGAAKGVRAEALRESDEGGGESAGKPGRLAKAAISKTKSVDAPSAAKALEEKFGTTDDYADTAFMMPDGKKITAAKMHDAMLRDVGYEQEGDTADSIRSRFINDAKAVRVRYGMERGGNTLHLSVPKEGVTPEQIREMKGAAKMMGRNGNIVMERADVTSETKDALSKVKEFGTANDIEPMLREIGAHPEGPKGGPEKPSLKKTKAVPQELSDIANKHNTSEGREAVKEVKLGVDPRQNEMADAYAAASHEPNNPAVKKSYDALKSDLDKQYDLLVKKGYKIDTKPEDPYEAGDAEGAYKALRDDVVNNKHISVWEGAEPPADHPMSEVDPKTGLTYNEKFRAVHDIFGHIMHDNNFSAEGEESAWGSHNQMFSPEARPALATETRGQTAYVTKHGEFTDQKATILPEEFHGRPEEAPSGDWSKQVEQKPFGGVNPNNLEAPSKKYAFEVAPEHRHTPSTLTAKEAQAYAKRPDVKAALAAHPDIKLGWDTTTQNRPELNVGVSTDDLDTAKKVAGKLDQRAIVDTETGEEISAGGEGKRTSFPEYPMEERLKDLGIKASLTKSPKGSSVPLMDNPLEVKGSGEGGEVNTLDITKALNKFSRKSNPALEPGSEPKEMVERAKKIAEDEAKYQLAQSKTGTEWYTTEMKEHDNVLQRMRPELAGGEVTGPNTAMPGHPVKLTLFKAAEGILSSGQKPYANVKSAVKAWDLYKETGEFPRINPETGKSWGPRGVNAYGSAFDSVNKLIQEKGEKGAADWLLMEHPVKELRSYQASGQSPVKGKAADLETGAMILGAKRGPFMQNLHGVESKFTADMWVSRTWNRWMGTLDLDPRIEDKGKVTSASDAPRNNAERSLMRESFSKTADKLKLTTSSLQAVLWYYEQALYRAHGIPVESWSFSDAAKRVEKESAPTAEQESFPFGESAKGKGVEAGLGGVLKSKFANISGKNKP